LADHAVRIRFDPEPLPFWRLIVLDHGTTDRLGNVMTNPLILKLEQRDRLSDEEREVLKHAVAFTKVFAKGEDLVKEGDRPGESKLLLEGFAARYKILRNGKRQITDLHSFVIKRMDHSIGALTSCNVAFVPHDTIRAITETQPHLARLLWLHTAIDAAIHRQQIVTIGGDQALGRMAHLFCELFVRLRSVGQTEDHGFNLPLTQSELGDTLGLSTVHVNRTIQELRAQGLITWRGDFVTIENWERLTEVADFDPSYLNLVHEPR
jgi:CRP-like cAMP-binding protein